MVINDKSSVPGLPRHRYQQVAELGYQENQSQQPDGNPAPHRISALEKEVANYAIGLSLLGKYIYNIKLHKLL